MTGRRGNACIRPELDPAVKFVLHAIRDRKTDRDTYWRVEAEAGLGADTIRVWHYREFKRGPSIHCVRAALNVLGYDLAIVPLRAQPEEWS